MNPETIQNIPGFGLLSAMRQRARHATAIRRIKQRGIWFVDIPRTSSSSVRVELGKAFGSPYGKWNTDDKRHRSSQVFPDHMTAAEMRQLVGCDAWDRLYTFAIVRNPWERVYSHYSWRRRRGRISPDLPFSTYLEQLRGAAKGCDEPNFKKPHFWMPCWDFVFDSSGKQLVTYIARFEDRDADLKQVREAIGLPTLGAQHEQRSDRRKDDQDAAFDRVSIEIVHDVFHKDIEAFGYTYPMR